MWESLKQMCTTTVILIFDILIPYGIVQYNAFNTVIVKLPWWWILIPKIYRGTTCAGSGHILLNFAPLHSNATAHHVWYYDI